MAKKIVKKLTKKRLVVKKAKSRNLLFPILGVATLATLGLALFFALPKATPLSINEVAATIPACTNFVSLTGMTKNTYAPGEKINYSCTFSEPDLNCNWGMTSEPMDLAGNKLLGWSEDRKTANFEAYTPRIPGTYTSYCQLGGTPECNAKGITVCNTKAQAFTYTVTGTAVAKPINISHQCSTDGKKVKIIWDNSSLYAGFLPRLDNLSNNVANSGWVIDSTDYNGDTQTNNYLERDIIPNNTYKFWVHGEGSENVISEASGLQFTCSNLTCNNKIDDSFDSENSLYNYSNPRTSIIQNGQASFSSNGRMITAVYNGNFVAILNISNANANTANPVMIARNFYDVRTKAVKIEYSKTNGKIESGRLTKADGVTDVFDEWKTISIDSSKQPTAYKIERQGSTFRTYAKISGSDWQQIGTYDNLTTDPVFISFGSGNVEKTSFDSFSLNCGAPSAPSNPRSTCNPDGKSVRLMWDTVDGAQSYKARIDDKAGKILSFDGITKGEYIATISPNITYSWWAHASKDGIDSNETSRLEFKCVATSTPTPTPKPTVKPTVKPTASPTVAPTSAPTNPTYVAPSSTTQKYDIPVTTEAETTPVATASKNPIARFFTWLASLFE